MKQYHLILYVFGPQKSTPFGRFLAAIMHLHDAESIHTIYLFVNVKVNRFLWDCLKELTKYVKQGVWVSVASVVYDVHGCKMCACECSKMQESKAYEN